jgi:hypothetical protein
MSVLFIISSYAKADQSLCLERSCFLLKDGLVYYTGGSNQPLGLLRSGREIISFKNHLYARDSKGTVWMWTQDSACWIELASHIVKWKTDENSFFLINNKDQLLVYSGEDYSFLRIEDSEKMLCSAGNVFKATKFKNVLDINLSQGKTEIIMRKNKIEIFYKQKRLPASQVN